jgi:hypothetical protein
MKFCIYNQIVNMYEIASFLSNIFGAFYSFKYKRSMRKFKYEPGVYYFPDHFKVSFGLLKWQLIGLLKLLLLLILIMPLF